MSKFKWLATGTLVALIATGCASSRSDQLADDPSPQPAESLVEVPSEPQDEDSVAADTSTTSEPAVQDPASSTASTSAQCQGPLAAGRVDVRSDGNRFSDASIDLATATATDVELPGTIEWVVSAPAGGWLLTTTDGIAHQVTNAGEVITLGPVENAPPVVRADGTIGVALDGHDLFDAPLIDGRVVQSDSIVAVLSTPTDRYAHGVLGDAIEAAAIEWVNVCDDTSGRIEISEPDVIEGVAPILADIDDDGATEVLVTLSNSSGGARLVAYELDGSLLAESAPIGQGNRWRNQLAVAAFGPAGEIEIVDVQTPHIGGILQSFQLVEVDGSASLERVAASGGRFTSHPIGTRNLDMGIALDANLDGSLDVLIATFERDRLIAMSRSTGDGGWEQVAEVALPGILTSNVAVSDSSEPSVAVGVGTLFRTWK